MSERSDRPRLVMTFVSIQKVSFLPTKANSSRAISRTYNWYAITPSSRSRLNRQFAKMDAEVSDNTIYWTSEKKGN